MIVKIQNSGDSWSYFECQIIHSKYTILGDIEIKEAIVLFQMPPISTNKEGKKITVLNLETEKRHLRTVITDRACYILNDQGKTIDKI